MPSSTEERDETERQALEWFVRMNRGDVTRADRLAFRAWLSGGRDRHDAFQAAKRLWNEMDGPAAQWGGDGWHRRTPRRPSRLKPAFRALAVAASLAAVGLGLGVLRDAGLIDRAMADHATRPGEQREIVLPDGSSAFLDGDTAIRVDMAGPERRVELLRGRVFLDVRHDEARTFEVSAGTVETRVLGTAFAVEGDADHVGVSVERGRVGVSTPDRRIELTAGQEVSAEGGRLGAVRSVDVQTAHAWRRGIVVLDAAPLSRIVDELARMQTGRILVSDASLRSMTMSGVFSVRDPGAVLEALRTGLGLHVAEIPGVATVIYR
ncbi:DUF4880 domain-containing protein [Aureimonas flava]|uniref:DUF4880 domain-containing protein n=1 Tax=Aureimonas flava TaxID=2320271 RepID=A0A3A1WJ78_9HYPH|nr:FecR domain-containing protein [Aureimonas flava]RIY01063.1 DUF4880 domain-containing protein [Aureimonas flava]